MAHALHLDTLAPGNGIFGRLRRSHAAYQSFLATRDELDGLSDRDLADLGISRLNIPEVARDAAYGG